jgi:diguanylate cyclase (GGDEF)-like protein/PAS domain S-box-containing protein
MIATAMVESARHRAGREEELRLGRLLEDSPFAVLEWDEDGAIRRWNRTAAAVFGMESDSVIGRPVLDLLFPTTEQPRVERTWNALSDTGVNRSTHRNRTGRGDSIVCEWSFFERRPGAGSSGGMSAIVADITDRIEAELQLSHIHTHDELTDLPNRNLLIERMRQCIARRRRNPDFKFAVLFLDLDRFKFINDSLGHRVGDELLRVVARRLQSQLRAVDTIHRTDNATTVARLGGDEFTILLEGLREEFDATRVAERVLNMLRSPFRIDGHEVHCGGSIGIAMSSLNYESPEDILRDADIAMYRAKATTPGKYVVFDSEMHGRFLALVQLENDLRKAVTREEWFLVYQPIVELVSGRLKGFEALIRWRHPSAGVIPPIKFIPVAEDTGLIIPMGDWTLRDACRRMRGWLDRFPEASDMSVSVNLSSKQFRQPQLVERIREILAEVNLPAPNLRLEITESDVMDDVRRTAGMLKELRDVGVKLAIDDFGTGHSSLSYLHRLPADTLKVDRSFVMAMNEERENREIVKTIVDLAHHLRMNVTAEGVETAAHLASLQELGCEQGQGYYFSKPLEAERAEAGLAAGSIWLPDAAR